MNDTIKKGYIMDVNIKLLNDKAKIPTRGSEHSAGYDLYAVIDNVSGIQTVLPHSQVTVGLGFSIEIPEGYFGGIFARSGIARSKGLRPSNCVGVIDSDYRGEVMISVRNDTDEIMGIEDGERIGQLLILPFVDIDFNSVDDLTETVRGEGGFGSTGSN